MALRLGPSGHAAILRRYGAKVGPGTRIDGPLHVVNAPGDFRNLTIGKDAWLGADTMVDLSFAVTIGEGAVLARRCTLLTAPERRLGREGGPVHIGEGAILETGVTVLPGLTVGAGANAGVHSLVAADIPAGAAVVSPEPLCLAPRGSRG